MNEQNRTALLSARTENKLDNIYWENHESKPKIYDVKRVKTNLSSNMELSALCKSNKFKRSTHIKIRE